MATKVTATTERGGRKLSDATRDKLRAKGRATWESMTPEQREKSMANLAKGRAAIGTKPPAPVPDPPPGPPATGGPRNPLDDAPGARPDRVPQPQGQVTRTNGHAAPPVFRIPDLPPLELGGGSGEDPAGSVDAGGGGIVGNVTVTADQVGTLLAFPFEFVALRRGRHWKLRDDERAMIAEPLARKLNEHAAAARLVSAGGD
jgi:hypothetical protein